jgi:hypothetical protein
VLETTKIRSAGFAQGYDFAVDNSVVGKITERLGDLWESFVEVLVVPRVENGFAVFDSDGAVAVEFDFVGPIRPIRECRNQGAFHWLDEFSFPSWKSFEAS